MKKVIVVLAMLFALTFTLPAQRLVPEGKSFSFSYQYQTQTGTDATLVTVSANLPDSGIGILKESVFYSFTNPNGTANAGMVSRLIEVTQFNPTQPLTTQFQLPPGAVVNFVLVFSFGARDYVMSPMGSSPGVTYGGK